MAALATMAANVSHEVGNPLAVISGVAEGLAEQEAQGVAATGTSRLLLEQTARIARMTRQVADFATARSQGPEWVDVNAMVKAMCDFLLFDRRFRGTPIEFQSGAALPARELVPDHLNEVLMSLLQACVEGGPCTRIGVTTTSRGDSLVIALACEATPARAPPLPEARLESVRRRVAQMGGTLLLTASGVEIDLPPSRKPAAAA